MCGLDWERAPGPWVTITAQGQYAERDVVTALAGALVDGPQAMPVQLHLAPAGYSLDFFKDDGRTVRLWDDADPARGLTVRLPFPDEVAPVEQLPDVADGSAGRPHPGADGAARRPGDLHALTPGVPPLPRIRKELGAG
jgi:hypothetical protein